MGPADKKENQGNGARQGVARTKERGICRLQIAWRHGQECYAALPPCEKRGGAPNADSDLASKGLPSRKKQSGLSACFSVLGGGE